MGREIWGPETVVGAGLEGVQPMLSFWSIDSKCLMFLALGKSVTGLFASMMAVGFRREAGRGFLRGEVGVVSTQSLFLRCSVEAACSYCFVHLVCSLFGDNASAHEQRPFAGELS